MNQKWDRRFLQLAKEIAAWSKDPSTKVGAVITKNKQIISLGFNGFAQGVDDNEERLQNRDFKYAATLHAEVNAILFARCDLSDCSIYVYPMQPCSQCMAKIIQTGIRRIVTCQPTPEQLERWTDSFKIAECMAAEAGVNITVCLDAK